VSVIAESYVEESALARMTAWFDEPMQSGGPE
jgi:hypothetical protein